MSTAMSRERPFGPARLPRRRLLISGILMAVLGVSAPIFPREATVAVGATFGWFLWFAGAAALGLSLLLLQTWPRLTGMLVSSFIIGAGIYLTFRPETGALAVAILLAAAFVAEGSFQLALALRLRPVKAWRWMLASGFSSLVAAGLIGLGVPERSTVAIGVLLGLALISTGLALVAVALTRHGEPV